MKVLNNLDIITVDEVELAANAAGFSIAGGTAKKTLTVSKNLTLDGVDGKTLTLNNSLTLAASADAKTLNIGNGGTLGTAAFTASTTYAAASHALTGHTVSGLTTGHFLKALSATTFGFVAATAADFNAIVNAGNVPSLASGLEGARPAAGTVGRIYITSDTKTIFMDNGLSWDLIQSVDNEGKSFVVKRQEFTATASQTAFVLTGGTYVVGKNNMNVYVSGIRQPTSAYTETNTTTVTLSEGVPAGTKVLLEWYEIGLVGMQGPKGDQGIQGIPGPKGDKGDKGDTGNIGPTPQHSWSGTSLRFETSPGVWGSYTDLKGAKGDKGDQGIQGPMGNLSLGDATWVTATKRLGINTTDPTHTLDVAGDARIRSNLTVGGFQLAYNSTNKTLAFNFVG